MLQLFPNPGSGSLLRILLLGAHSDDIEIGCGGTVRRLLQSYPEAEWMWVVFSAEEPERRREATASAEQVLGAAAHKQIVIKQFRTSYFPHQGEAIKEYFEAIKSAYQPDVVFTHCRHDLHQDHRVLCELTWNTFRNHLILEYEIPKYDGDLGVPNVFVPLHPTTVDHKIDHLMRAFGTQRPKHWFSPETFRALMRIRGLECAQEYAEAFYARKVTLGMPT